MTASILWTAFLLDLVLGDPRRIPHPVEIMGNVVSWLEAMVRRRTDSRRTLTFCGALLTLTVVGGAYGASLLILSAAELVSPVVQWVVTVFLAYTTLAVKGLYTQSWIVVKAVRDGRLHKARKLLSRIVGRDTDHLDQEGILTAVIETVAENISDGIIAPLFYLMLGGVPMAMAFKAVSTIDSMLGYKEEPYRYIGWFGARLDDAANFIPARVSALLIVLSAIVLRLDHRSAWNIWRRDGRKHASPNGGQPEAAMAGALRVQLGGPGSYFGRIMQKPYLGDRLTPVSVDSARQAEKVLFSCSVIMILTVTLFL